MLKKGIVLIMLGLIFSSCDFIYYGRLTIQDNIARRERERNQEKKMDHQQQGTLSMKQE